MAEAYDLIVRGGIAVTPDGRAQADIGVRQGRIAAMGDLARASAPTIVEARHLHLLPGVIDTQVHFREPGLEHKEDIATGTAGAVLGGVTAVFDMPNTDPSTTTAADLADKVARARGRARCDIAFFVGADDLQLAVEPVAVHAIDPDHEGPGLLSSRHGAFARRHRFLDRKSVV